MKLATFALLILFSVSSPADALFAETNFIDSPFSALVRNMELKKGEEYPGWSGFQLYHARLKIVDVYYGDLNRNDEIDIRLNLDVLGLKGLLETVQQDYIVSFCQSKSGIYYTYRNYLILPAREDIVAQFEGFRTKGADLGGDHDCTPTNYHELDPDAAD